MIAIFGIIYTVFPILSTPLALIGLYLDKKRYKYYSFAIALNLAFIGYHFEPLFSDDLYRHFLVIDKLRETGFREIFSLYSSDPLIMKNIWFYLVSITNINGLLPFSAIFITYFIILKDVFGYSKNEKLRHFNTVNITLITLLFFQLIWVMSGIRFSTSIALFLHGLYREFALKKKDLKTYLFYIIPCFIHYSIFVILLVRCSINIMNKFKVVAIVGLLTWGYFTNSLITILNTIENSYIQGIVFKGYLYINYTNESNYMQVMYWFKLMCCIVMITSILMLEEYNKYFYNKYKSIYNFAFYISLFCIGGANIFIIIDRFGQVVVLLSPFVLIPLIEYINSKFFKQLCAVSLIPIVLVGLYFQYVPLKATNYGITLLDFFTRNIVAMFIK